MTTNTTLQLRRDVLKEAKEEQMGLNAALKALRNTKGFAALVKADGLQMNIFASAEAWVNNMKHLPIYFNDTVCRAVPVKDDEGNLLRVDYVTRTSYTPYVVYMIARKAVQAAK